MSKKFVDGYFCFDACLTVAMLICNCSGSLTGRPGFNRVVRFRMDATTDGGTISAAGAVVYCIDSQSVRSPRNLTKLRSCDRPEDLAEYRCDCTFIFFW